MRITYTTYNMLYIKPFEKGFSLVCTENGRPICVYNPNIPERWQCPLRILINSFAPLCAVQCTLNMPECLSTMAKNFTPFKKKWSMDKASYAYLVFKTPILGCFGCDGAFSWQTRQFARTLSISGFKPGNQKTSLALL